MTSYLVRTDAAVPAPADLDVRVLDWNPMDAAATIQTGREWRHFTSSDRPTAAAADVMLLGAATYCADKTSARARMVDAWTRELAVQLPVSDVDAWRSAGWPRVLNFLTGDDWTIEPYAATTDTRTTMVGQSNQPQLDTDTDTVVCLFSGGLDSLSGAIDLLADDPDRRVILIGHNEGGQAATAQDSLFKALHREYGDRAELRQLFLRPAPPRAEQERPLPDERENTTRARSLLFIAAGLLVASAVSPDTPLHVPENGFIGINVPLTRARAGSLSTRTTHPHFMDLLRRALDVVGVPNPVVNPYRLMTKGELLAASKNPDLLAELASASVSCAHPETPRWESRKQGNCGYCFPCLIRRASLAHVGRDDGRDYSWDALTDPALLDVRSGRSADLRAVVAAVTGHRDDRDAIKNGPLPTGERRAFVDMWRRGLAEIRSWLANASGPLAARLR